MDTNAVISVNDQKLLDKFSTGKKAKTESKEGGVNLADLIMQKMEAGDYKDGNNIDAFEKQMQNTVDTMDPKIISAYQKIGVVLKTFRSGKLRKAFKVIPLV